MGRVPPTPYMRGRSFFVETGILAILISNIIPRIETVIILTRSGFSSNILILLRADPTNLDTDMILFDDRVEYDGRMCVTNKSQSHSFLQIEEGRVTPPLGWWLCLSEISSDVGLGNPIQIVLDLGDDVEGLVDEFIVIESIGIHRHLSGGKG